MKSISIFTVLIFSVCSVMAQNCLPENSITEPGVYPDQLDTAYPDQPYEFILQILAIEDTLANIGGQEVYATIDSIVVTGVQNLPDGFDYLCEPSTCTFLPKEVGCVKLTGNPTVKQAGTYLLTINTTVYGKVGIIAVPYNQDNTDYQLTIKGDGTSSISTMNKSQLKIYPNPSQSGKYVVELPSVNHQISVINMAGKKLQPTITRHSGKTIIDLSHYAKGIYLMSIETSEGVETYKLVH